jgi:hypothetical protein
MSRCQHPGVVAFTALYETKKTFEVVMEFCPAGEWFDTVRAASTLQHFVVLVDLNLTIRRLLSVQVSATVFRTQRQRPSHSSFSSLMLWRTYMRTSSAIGEDSHAHQVCRAAHRDRMSHAQGS